MGVLGESDQAVFQSTPPARGATCVRQRAGPLVKISIHAPREGGDVEVPGMDGAIDLFQSTPPARGATPADL